MKQVKYDVVVIGSGVGGTTSAALLAKAGYKTLVVEKLPFAGGRCATHDYHGYKLNTGTEHGYRRMPWRFVPGSGRRLRDARHR